MASIRALLAPAAMARSAPYLQVPAAPQAPPVSRPTPSRTFSMNYYQVPDRYKANFSTKLGHSRKRSLADPLPAVVVRSHMDKDVIAKAAALKLEFPDYCQEVQIPTRWDDLYHYFDGYDLFVEGQEFCFHVIKLIGEENVYLKAKLSKEIDTYAGEWVMYNSHAILSNIAMSDMYSMFTHEEQLTFADLQTWQKNLLMDRLATHRSALVKAQQELERREYESRLPLPLFPVAENRLSPMALSQTMAQPNDPQHGSRMAPVALQPVPHIPFNKFMHNQRMVSNPSYPSDPSQWSRARGASDASRYSNGSRGPRFNDDTRRISPPRDQTVYVLNPNAAPQYPAKSETIPSMPGTFSNDARNDTRSDFRNDTRAGTRNDHRNLKSMFSDPSKVHIGNSGSATVFYSGPFRAHTADGNNSHTVYVGPVDRTFFISHGLCHEMLRFGDIDAIHFPGVNRPGLGSAFVTFMEEDSVEKAMRALDGQLLNGTPVKVNRPHSQRSRSNSNFSQQGGYNNRPIFYKPKDFEEFRPRTQFMQSSYYEKFNDGPALATGTFPTNDETFRSMSGGVLSSIENLPAKPSVTSELDLAALAKKENAPLKRSQNSTPSSKGNTSSSRGNSGKKRLRPTPSSTPSKSRSEVKLPGMADNLPPQMGQSETAQIPKSKKKKNPKRKPSATAPSESPSFTTDVSESFKSSTESGTMESFTSQNTSAASLSRQHSRASAMSEMTMDAATVGSAPKQRNASGRGRKSGNQQNQQKKENNPAQMQQIKADDELPQHKQSQQAAHSKKGSVEKSQSKQNGTPAQPEKESHENAPSKQNEQPAQIKKEGFEDPQAKHNEQPAQTANGSHEKAQAKQSEQPVQKKKESREKLQVKEIEQPAQATKESRPKAQSNQNEHQKNHKKETNEHSGLGANAPSNKKETRAQTHPKTEQPVQQVKTDEEKPRGKENKPIGKENEPLKPLKNDAAPVASQRKADSKDSKGNKKSVDDGPIIPDKIAQSPPKQVHEDPLQWPALGPSLSNQNVIADGKRPPPLPSMRVVPAVPLISKKPRPQTTDFPHDPVPEGFDPDPYPNYDEMYTRYFIDGFEDPPEELPPTPEPPGSRTWPFVKSFRESNR